MLINQPCWKADVSAQGENKTVKSQRGDSCQQYLPPLTIGKSVSQSKLRWWRMFRISANFAPEIPTGYVVYPLSLAIEEESGN